jgi:tetratricopeptide (TPR) repeat protein
MNQNIITSFAFCDMKSGKSYVLITIVITLCVLSSCSRHQAADSPAPAVSDTAIVNAQQKADELFKGRENLQNLQNAVSILATVRDPDHRNFEVEWKFSKYSYFLGKQTENEDEAEKILKEGRDAGKIASRVAPDKPDGYFWFGANLGEMSRRSPITVGIKSVDDIREAMNKVIELQPDYQNASAYDALAQVEMATRLTGGSADKAVEYLEKGLAAEKGNALLRVHLAQAYLAVKKDAKAKEQIDYVLHMTPPPDYLPEYRQSVELARKLLHDNF